ncbi:MAG: EamA family transporter [Bdellovibrionales bacterium]
MSNHVLAYYLALGSSLCFAGGSLLFADIARKISPLWMNAFKAILAWVCFSATVVIFGVWVQLSTLQIAALLGSGILGLAIGDIFLLTAYARMGAARTLILWGFQPLFIAVEAYFLFHQDLSWTLALAVLFFLACLFTFSLEKFKQDGHWELYGLGAALIAVILDNSGLVLSRWVFDTAPDMNAFQCNFIRSSGALMFFFVFGSVRKIHLLDGWRRLGSHGRVVATVASFLGCFFSLCLYLTAVKIGHLASISALSAAGPILASAMECLYLRKRPTAYLLIALALFLAGFAILTLI